MFLEDAAGKAFPLVRLKKLAAAGVNDLGSIASKTSPLPQAAASKQRQKLQTRALQKAAPPPVASSKPSTMAPKPLDISMPKIAALNKLQLLLTKQAAVVNYDYAPEDYAIFHDSTGPNDASVAMTWDDVMQDPRNAHIKDPNQKLKFLMQEMGLPAKSIYLKKANLAQPVASSSLLPSAPNITTTTPIQRANNLHADKTNGNGAGGNMNPGSARVNSVIDDIGALSTAGGVNGNAGQGVRNAGTKLAMVKLRKLLNSRG